MSQFNEFDASRPVYSAPDTAATVSPVAAEFPEATALVADLREMYPELFAGAKVIYMAEGGREIKTRKYREIEHMQGVDVGAWFEIGEASKRNALYANRRRR